MRSTARIADVIRNHRKSMVIAGAAAALMGSAGTASAATVTAAPKPPLVKHASASAYRQADSIASLFADTSLTAAPAAKSAPAHDLAALRETARVHQAGSAHRTVSVRRPAPAADQLRPVAFYGPQETMQITSAQHANATTIVKQALKKKMGVRSAVIAVATAMQESELNNINYGTSDSLGLFQQRPSCGWGTAQQIMNPAYSADAFLNALKGYQASNPDWAHQPLYQTAQGVQASAYPTAYAKWEAQAAGLVQQITKS
jgi:hypothetical protein